jgi:hypothetical protein
VQRIARASSRLVDPAPQLAAALDRADLQAAFPLRVAGALDGILGLAADAAAAGDLARGDPGGDEAQDLR